MVLDGVIGPSGKPFSNKRPFVANPASHTKLLLVGLDDSLVLFFRPTLLPDVRIEVVMPSLPALLADASW
jgi:hypothetical protein